MICSLSILIVGIFMVFGGGILSFIYYTEITPQNHEAYHEKYIGLNYSGILGPLMLMIGLILFWGGNILFVKAYQKHKSSRHTQLEHY